MKQCVNCEVSKPLAYCLERFDDLEIEHVIALVRGGSNYPENIVPACRSCNAAKGYKPVFLMAMA